MTGERGVTDEEARREEEQDKDDSGWAAAEGGCCLLQVFAAVTGLALLIFVPTMI